MENKEEEKSEESQHSSPKKFLRKKRLIKRRDVLKKNAMFKKQMAELFDEEAELGSDNEDHDDIVKRIDKSEEGEDIDNEEELLNVPNLINDNLDEKDLDDAMHKEKYFDDMILQDKEEIKKVIEGPQRRAVENAMAAFNENEEDIPLKLRLEKMSMKNYEDDKEISELTFNSLMKNFKKMKRQLEKEQNNQELKEAMENYENTTREKFVEIHKIREKEIQERMKENEEILKNVTFIGKKKEDESSNNDLISKEQRLELKKQKRISFGLNALFTKKNSFLYHMKLDKTKSDSQGKENTDKNCLNFNEKFSTSFEENKEIPSVAASDLANKAL